MLAVQPRSPPRRRSIGGGDPTQAEAVARFRQRAFSTVRRLDVAASGGGLPVGGSNGGAVAAAETSAAVN